MVFPMFLAITTILVIIINLVIINKTRIPPKGCKGHEGRLGVGREGI